MRRLAVRGSLPAESGHTLMRGRNSALYSRQLFSGFMRCATCGGASSSSRPAMSPRYGCFALLAEWHRGLCESPYAAGEDRRCPFARRSSSGTARAHNSPVHHRNLDAGIEPPDQRAITPDRRGSSGRRTGPATPSAPRGRDRKRSRCVDNLASAIAERQADVARYDAVLAELAEPLHERLAVMPV